LSLNWCHKNVWITITITITINHNIYLYLYYNIQHNSFKHLWKRTFNKDLTYIKFALIIFFAFKINVQFSNSLFLKIFKLKNAFLKHILIMIVIYTLLWHWFKFNLWEKLCYIYWMNDWQWDSSVHDVNYKSFDFILCLNKN